MNLLPGSIRERGAKEVCRRSGLSLEDTNRGVVVAEVRPNSPAAEKGLAKGDIIARVNQDDVKSAKEVQDALAKAKKKGN